MAKRKADPLLSGEVALLTEEGRELIKRTFPDWTACQRGFIDDGGLAVTDETAMRLYAAKIAKQEAAAA